MVSVLHYPAAVSRNSCYHKLTDKTTEIGRHEKCLKAWIVTRVELFINEPKKLDKISHCKSDVFGRETVGKLYAVIEALRHHRMRAYRLSLPDSHWNLGES